MNRKHREINTILKMKKIKKIKFGCIQVYRYLCRPKFWNGALVKGLRRLPFTEESRVRFPYVVRSSRVKMKILTRFLFVLIANFVGTLPARNGSSRKGIKRKIWGKYATSVLYFFARGGAALAASKMNATNSLAPVAASTDRPFCLLWA